MERTSAGAAVDGKVDVQVGLGQERLRKELVSACQELPRRVSGRQAKRRIESILAATGCRVGDLREFWSHPEESLGPFERLPAGVRSALADAAFRHHQERELLHSERLYMWVHGGLYRFGCVLTRRAWGWRRKHTGPGARRLVSKLGFWTGRALTTGLERLGHGWVSATRFAPVGETPFLHAVWSYAGIDPTDIVQAYVSEIPIDPRVGPVYLRRSRRVASCALTGLDILPSAGDLYFLESNFNPGFRAMRVTLFPDGDPVARHLTAYAAERGYRRVIYFPFSNRALFPPELERHWQAIAAQRGIQLEVRDHPAITSPHRSISEILMDSGAEDTLYVNGMARHSPLEPLIRQKGRMEREIRRHNARVPEEERIAVPAQLQSDADVAALYDPDSRFPNVIVKNALIDRTHGITLYKTGRLPPDANVWPSAAYEFRRPDCVERPGTDPGSIYAVDHRAYLLIAPDGPFYLGTRTNVSATPVPERLADGKLSDIAPYACNLHLGDIPTAPTPAEDEQLSKVAVRIGTVIGDFLARKHNLDLDDPHAPEC